MPRITIAEATAEVARLGSGPDFEKRSVPTISDLTPNSAPRLLTPTQLLTPMPARITRSSSAKARR